MKNALIKTFLIFSPVIFTYLAAFIWSATHESGGSEAFGVMGLFMFIFGVPFVALTGLLFSFITRNRSNANKLSYLSYLIPASLTWLWVIPALI